MWETLYDTAVLAIVAEPLLRLIRKQGHRRRISRAVATLNRGETTRIRCAARFRNSGGSRHRAHLTVKTEGVFLSTVDSTVTELRLGTPHTGVEVVAELSMLVCDVSGRQLEVLLPAEEDRLFEAVVARFLGHSDEHAATTDTVPGSDSGSASAHHEG